MKLDLRNKGLTTLEGIDLTGVTELYCWKNQLMSLPTLPATLEMLDCSDNQLTSLPELPNGLRCLLCSKNKLEYLPTLPESLIELSCWKNKLKCLPILPKTLESLDVWYNNLSELPNLPSTLKFLDYYSNQIKNLPEISWHHASTILNIEGLTQHNEKRRYLGLYKISVFPNKEMWDDINGQYYDKYYTEGEGFQKVCENIKKIINQQL